MDHAHFPWRPLGTLLVEKSLLTPTELEHALEEQRRSGRLLGRIVVDAGFLSGFSLARALAEQHGVDVRPAAGARPPEQLKVEPIASQDGRTWRPLGKVLVEQCFLTQGELERALDDQRRRGGRLGEILVADGLLSGPALARALADQHGVALAPSAVLERQTVTEITPTRPDQPVYRVCRVAYAPECEVLEVLNESPNFLEAADFAFEYLDEHEPESLEIQKGTGEPRETVWRYSESRATAEAASRKKLVNTFGFDPMLWNPSRRSTSRD